MADCRGVAREGRARANAAHPTFASDLGEPCHLGGTECSRAAARRLLQVRQVKRHHALRMTEPMVYPAQFKGCSRFSNSAANAVSAPISNPTSNERECELRKRYCGSTEWWDRAQRVIPGGIHLSGRPLVEGGTTPLYFERGRGCRIWDVDGHEYIDYLMAFGAQLLGYAHPEVDRAVAEQSARGQLLSMNHRRHVEFIESLLPVFPGAEMGIFFRTGSEATTAALRIARRYTGRRKIARCGYHGWHDWCLPLEDFVPSGLESQVPEFRGNDPSTLRQVFSEHPGQIAAVILAPEMVLPFQAGIFKELLSITREHGAVFIMDEVKTAIRIAPNTISERVGIVPDLITASKGLGNGWPVAVTFGRREVMACAAGLHYSATFHGDTTAMAAATTTLRIVRDEGVQAHIEGLGMALIDGLNSALLETGVPGIAYGEPLAAMPFLRFTHPNATVNAAASRVFFQEVLAQGVLLHPRHLWFISQAHTDGDIDITLKVARSALEAAARTIAL
ncbi:MAG: aminotransferase class III-fold pyridoxal phosphate-dependent enzyme [Polyangiaceae bacterium]